MWIIEYIIFSGITHTTHFQVNLG